MINSVDSYIYQVLPSSAAAGISQQIRGLQTQLASLRNQLLAAERNATTKVATADVLILRVQITAIEARVAQLMNELANTSNNNSVSVQSANKENSNYSPSDYTGGVPGRLLDVYA